MEAFLAGIGLTIFALIMLFAGVVVFAGVIAVIRAALNSRLGGFGKIVWILLSLFVPGAAFLYFAFVDRNGFLRLVGWISIIFAILTVLMGGTAVWSGIEAMKNNARSFHFSCYSGPAEGNLWKLPECNRDETIPDNTAPETESPDDSSLSL